MKDQFWYSHYQEINELGIFLVIVEKNKFMQGIGQHVAALIKEKEETTMHSAENWLFAEAAKKKNIDKAGTFRYNSC